MMSAQDNDNLISWTDLTNQFAIPADYLTTKSFKDVQLEYYVKRSSDGTLSIIDTKLTNFTFKDATDTSRDSQSQLSIAMGSRGIETASDLASTSEQISAAKASQETQLIQQNLAKFNTELSEFKKNGNFPAMQKMNFVEPLYDTFKSKYEQLRIAFSNFLEISDAHSLESTQKSLNPIQAAGSVETRHPVLNNTELIPGIFVEQTAALTFYAAKYFVRLTICMLLNSFKDPTDVSNVVQKLPFDPSIKTKILEIIGIFETQIYPSDSGETTFSTKLSNKVRNDYKWYTDKQIKLSIDKIIYLLLKDSVKRNSSNTNTGLLDNQTAYYVNQYCDRIIFILTYWVQPCSIDSTKSNIVYLHDVLMDPLVAQKQITNPVITFVKHRNTDGLNHPRYNVMIDNQILEVHYSDDFSTTTNPPKTPPTKFVQNVKLRYGPFTEIYDNTKTNSDIVDSSAFQDNIYNKLTAGIPICIIGYGSSGSGKTSALIQLNAGGITQDGVLILISEKLGRAGYTNCFVNIIELLDANSKSENRFKQFTYEDSGITSNVQTETKQVWKQKGEKKYETTTKAFSDLTANSEEDNGQTVGDYIMHFMKTQRRTFKTPNNPESSRSHVIIVVKYVHATKDANDPAKILTLIICDFAGVENKFDCNSDTVDKDFISSELIDASADKRKLNQTELFQRQSIVKYTAKSVIDVNNLHAKLTVVDPNSTPYKNINTALTAATESSKFGSNEKIKIEPYYETIKDVFANDIDKLLIFINQLFYATTAQVDSTSLPVTITQSNAIIGDDLVISNRTLSIEHRIGKKTLPGTKDITRHMFDLQYFENPPEFYTEFANNNMVNIKYTAQGHVMTKKFQTSTTLDKYRDPAASKWTITDGTAKLPSEYANSNKLVFQKTYDGTLSGKLTIDEINQAINTIFPNFPEFLTDNKSTLTKLATMQYINQSNPNAKLDSNVIIPFAFWLRRHFLNDYNVEGMRGLFEQIIYKYNNSSIAQSGGAPGDTPGKGLCEDRLTEGYYINASLLNLRVAIKQLLSSKFGYGIPVFDGYCRANYQCSVEDADCMGSEEYPPIISEPPPNLNAGQLLETIYEYCEKDSKAKLTFCIFCAFNTSTNIKADVIPYIDISELQRLYQKLKGNMYTRSIIDLEPIMTGIQAELVRIQNGDAFDHLPSQPVKKEISENVFLAHNSNPLNPETILRATKRIIDLLIDSNDSTPPGTLDFTSEQGAKRFLGANTCSVAQLTTSGGGSTNSQLIAISGTRKGRTYSNSSNKYSKLRTKKIRK